MMLSSKGQRIVHMTYFPNPENMSPPPPMERTLFLQLSCDTGNVTSRDWKVSGLVALQHYDAWRSASGAHLPHYFRVWVVGTFRYSLHYVASILDLLVRVRDWCLTTTGVAGILW